MNTYIQYISSTEIDNQTNNQFYYSPCHINDMTNFVIDISKIPEKPAISNILINWDTNKNNNLQIYKNRLLKNYTKDSIFAELTAGKFSSIYTEKMTHIYRPATLNFSTFNCKITIDYINNVIHDHIVPIIMTNDSYDEYINELHILNINLLPLSSNNIKFSLATSRGDITEIITPD